MRDSTGRQSSKAEVPTDCDSSNLIAPVTADRSVNLTKDDSQRPTANDLPELNIIIKDTPDGAPSTDGACRTSTEDFLPDLSYIDFSVDETVNSDCAVGRFATAETVYPIVNPDHADTLKMGNAANVGLPGVETPGANAQPHEQKPGDNPRLIKDLLNLPESLVANFERGSEKTLPLAMEHYPDSTKWLLTQKSPHIADYFEAPDSNEAARALADLQKEAARNPQLQPQFKVLSLLDAELRSFEAASVLRSGVGDLSADKANQYLSKSVTDLLRLAPADIGQRLLRQSPKDIEAYLKTITDPVAREAAETLTNYAKSGILFQHLPTAMHDVAMGQQKESQDSHSAATEFLRNPFDAYSRTKVIKTFTENDRATRTNSLSEEVRELEGLDLAIKFFQAGDPENARKSAGELIDAAVQGNESAKRILITMAGDQPFDEMIEKARAGSPEIFTQMRKNWSPDEALGELRAKDGRRELEREPTLERVNELLLQFSKDSSTAGQDFKRWLTADQALRQIENPDTSAQAIKKLDREALAGNMHARAALSIVLSEDSGQAGTNMYIPDLADLSDAKRNEIKRQAVGTLATLMSKGNSLSEGEFTAMTEALSSRDLSGPGGKELRAAIEMTVDRACNQPSEQSDPSSVFKSAQQTEIALRGIFTSITTSGGKQKAAAELYIRAAESKNNRFALLDGATTGRDFGKQIDSLCSIADRSDAAIMILAGITKGAGEQNTSDNANPEYKRINPDPKVKLPDHGELSNKASDALVKAASQNPKNRDDAMAALVGDTAGKDLSTLNEKTLATIAALNGNDIPDYVHDSLKKSILQEKTDPFGAVDGILKLGKSISDRDADVVVQKLLEVGSTDPKRTVNQLLKMAETADSNYAKSIAVLALGAKNWQGVNLGLRGSDELQRVMDIKEANKNNPTIELAVSKLTHGAGQPLSLEAMFKDKGCQIDDQAIHTLVERAKQKYSPEQMQQIVHQMIMYNALPDGLRSEFSGSREKLEDGKTLSLGGRHIEAKTVNSSDQLRELLLGSKDLYLAETTPVLLAVRALEADSVKKLPPDFVEKLRYGQVAAGEPIPVSVLANCGITQAEIARLKPEHRQLLDGVLVFAPVAQSVPDLSNKSIPASEFNRLADIVRAKLNDGKTEQLIDGTTFSLAGKTLDADTVNLLPPKMRQSLTGSQAPLEQGRVLKDLSTIKLDSKQFNELTPEQRKGLTSISQRVDSLTLLGQLANHTLDATDSRVAFLASPDFEKRVQSARDTAEKEQHSLEVDLGILVSRKDRKLNELASHTIDGMSTWESLTSIGHDLEKSIWRGLPTVLTDDTQFEKTQRDLVNGIHYTETELSMRVLDSQRISARFQGLDVATKSFEYSKANAKGDRDRADECALNTTLRYGLAAIQNSPEMRSGLLARGEGSDAGVFARRNLPGEKAFETLINKDYSTDPKGIDRVDDALELLSTMQPHQQLAKRNDTSVMRTLALQQIDSTPAFVKLRDLNQKVFSDLSVLQREIEAGMSGDKCEDFFKDSQQRALRIKEALKTLDQKDFDQLRELKDSIESRLRIEPDQPGAIADAESRKSLKDRAKAIDSLLENLDPQHPHYKLDSERKQQLQQDLANVQQRIDRPTSTEQLNKDQRIKEIFLTELRQINQAERDGNGRGRLDRILSELSKPEWKVNDWVDWVKNDGVVMAASIGGACAALAIATTIVVASGGTAVPLLVAAAAMSAGGLIGSQLALEAQHGLGMRSHGSELGDYVRGDKKVNEDGSLRDMTIGDVAGKYTLDFAEGTAFAAIGIYGGQALGEVLQPVVNQALATAGVSLGKVEQQVVVEAVKRSLTQKLLSTAGQSFCEHLKSMTIFSLAAEATKATTKIALENAGIKLNADQEKALDMAIFIGLGAAFSAGRPIENGVAKLELKHSELKRMGGLDAVQRELELKGLAVKRTPQGNISATHPDGRVLEIRSVPDVVEPSPVPEKTAPNKLLSARALEPVQLSDSTRQAVAPDDINLSAFEGPHTMAFPPDPIKLNSFILKSCGRTDLAQLIQWRDTVTAGEQKLLRNDVSESTKTEIRENIRIARLRLSMIPLDEATETIVSKIEEQYRPVLDTIREFADLKPLQEELENIHRKAREVRDTPEEDPLLEVAEEKEIDLHRKLMETEIKLLRAAKAVDTADQFQVLKIAFADATGTISPGEYMFRGTERGSEHLDGMKIIVEDSPVSQKLLSESVASLTEAGLRPKQLVLKPFDFAAEGHFDIRFWEIMVNPSGDNFRVITHEGGHMYAHQMVDQLPVETQNILRDSWRRSVANAGERMADVALGKDRNTTNSVVKNSLAQDLLETALTDTRSRQPGTTGGDRARYYICDSEVFAEMSAFHAVKQRLLASKKNPDYRQLIEKFRADNSDRAHILDSPEFEQHFKLLEKLVFDPRVQAQKAFKTYQDQFGRQEMDSLKEALRSRPSLSEQLDVVKEATNQTKARMRGTIIDQLFAKELKLNPTTMDVEKFDSDTKDSYDEYCRLKNSTYNPTSDTKLTTEARTRLTELLDTVKAIEALNHPVVEQRFEEILKESRNNDTMTRPSGTQKPKAKMNVDENMNFPGAQKGDPQSTKTEQLLLSEKPQGKVSVTDLQTKLDSATLSSQNRAALQMLLSCGQGLIVERALAVPEPLLDKLGFHEAFASSDMQKLENALRLAKWYSALPEQLRLKAFELEPAIRKQFVDSALTDSAVPTTEKIKQRLEQASEYQKKPKLIDVWRQHATADIADALADTEFEHLRAESDNILGLGAETEAAIQLAPCPEYPHGAAFKVSAIRGGWESNWGRRPFDAELLSEPVQLEGSSFLDNHYAYVQELAPRVTPSDDSMDRFIKKLGSKYEFADGGLRQLGERLTTGELVLTDYGAVVRSGGNTNTAYNIEGQAIAARDEMENQVRNNTDRQRAHRKREARLRVAEQEDTIRRKLDTDFTKEQQIVIQELRDGSKIKDAAVRLLLERNHTDFSDSREIEKAAEEVRIIKKRARQAGILD